MWSSVDSRCPLHRVPRRFLVTRRSGIGWGEIIIVYHNLAEIIDQRHAALLWCSNCGAATSISPACFGPTVCVIDYTENVSQSVRWCQTSPSQYTDDTGEWLRGSVPSVEEFSLVWKASTLHCTHGRETIRIVYILSYKWLIVKGAYHVVVPFDLATCECMRHMLKTRNANIQMTWFRVGLQLAIMTRRVLQCRLGISHNKVCSV